MDKREIYVQIMSFIRMLGRMSARSLLAVFNPKGADINYTLCKLVLTLKGIFYEKSILVTK